jgi:predicted PurR-regulated permease PerM
MPPVETNRPATVAVAAPVGGGNGVPMETALPPRPRTFYPYVILGALLFAFIEAFPLLSPILLSLLLTLLLSLALNPVITRIREWSGGRTSATVMIALAFAVVLGLTTWAFFAPMKKSMSKLAEKIPVYWERLQGPLQKLSPAGAAALQEAEPEPPYELETPAAAVPVAPEGKSEPGKVSKEGASLGSNLVEMLAGVAGRFAAAAFNAAQILVVLVTVFFGVAFTLMNPRPIFGSVFALVPERHHERTLAIARRIARFVPGWAGATLLGMGTIGLLVFLLMWPIFGFSDALVLGLIAGMLEAVPFVGPMLAAVPALVFAAGQGGMTPVWVVLCYLGIQALENNVIVPVVMARNMKLHPVAVIFSMLLCVAAFGVLGVIVAAPLVAITGILYDEIYRKRFLPHVSDEDLDGLARKALGEKLKAEG